jgi:hypothetical protein
LYKNYLISDALQLIRQKKNVTKSDMYDGQFYCLGNKHRIHKKKIVTSLYFREIISHIEAILNYFIIDLQFLIYLELPPDLKIATGFKLHPRS